MSAPATAQPAALTPAEQAALQGLLRANGIVRGEIGKLLRTPLSPASRALWTALDEARALEANVFQRLLEASKDT